MESQWDTTTSPAIGCPSQEILPIEPHDHHHPIHSNPANVLMMTLKFYAPGPLVLVQSVMAGYCRPSSGESETYDYRPVPCGALASGWTWSVGAMLRLRSVA